MSMHSHIFSCESALVLSRGPLKRRRAELHFDTKKKSKGAEMSDKGTIQLVPCAVEAISLNSEQICNAQTSAMALGPPAGKC